MAKKRPLLYDTRTLLVAAIVAWFAAMIGPLLLLEFRPADGSLVNPTQEYLPYAAGAMILADILLLNTFIKDGAWKRSPARWAWTVFLLVGAVSLITGRITSLFYVAVFLFLCLNFSLFWQLPEHLRRLGYQGIAILGLTVLLAALWLFGLPVSRYVGAIHPNLFGAVALAIAIIAVMAYPRAGWAIFAICFVLAAIVNSRYAMVSMALFAFIFVARRGGRNVWLKVAAVAAGASLVIIFAEDILSLFRVGSQARGFGSGLAGRTETWTYFEPQFFDAPLLGYGFRDRAAYFGTHNGYLNTLLENGLVVGGLIVGYVLYRAARGIAATPDREMLCANAGIAAIALACFFQPQLINFGDAMGVVLLMLLMAPHVSNTPRKRRRAGSRSSSPMQRPPRHHRPISARSAR